MLSLVFLSPHYQPYIYKKCFRDKLSTRAGSRILFRKRSTAFTFNCLPVFFFSTNNMFIDEQRTFKHQLIPGVRRQVADKDAFVKMEVWTINVVLTCASWTAVFFWFP